MSLWDEPLRAARLAIRESDSAQTEELELEVKLLRQAMRALIQAVEELARCQR